MNQRTTVSRKPYNLKPLNQSCHQPKYKRIKKVDKFHYDLDKLTFTIGRINQYKTPLKRRKEAEKEGKRKEAEEAEKAKRKEEEKKEATRKEEEKKEAKRKEKGFPKASPEELSYRDLFVKTKFLEKSDICSICLYSFIKQRFAWKLSCNHYFHYDCIEKWSDMEKYTCPLCRQEYYHP